MTLFNDLLNQIKTRHVYIQTHNFPDPDAIASAYGLSKLLETQGIASTITYGGVIDRCNTAQMITTLEIPLFERDKLNDYNYNDEIILVDAQGGNSNLINPDENHTLCIDHHPVATTPDYKFYDIRPDVGACSSIIAEYFFDNNISLEPNVATALLYGIKIDTANLTRAVSELDLDMMYRLYRYIDKEILHTLEHNTIEISDLYAYSNAINNIRICGDVSFANTGRNCPEALIASISDFMLALSDIHLSVVYSFQDTGIKLSIRSDENHYDSGKICKAALKNLGNGGGHPSMAGGFIPYISNDSTDELADEYYISQIEKRFAQKATPQIK